MTEANRKSDLNLIRYALNKISKEKLQISKAETTIKKEAWCICLTDRLTSQDFLVVISIQRDLINNTFCYVLILLAIIVVSFQVNKKISALKIRLDFCKQLAAIAIIQ